MKLPRILSRGAEPPQHAENQETTVVPEGYEGPLAIRGLGIRFLNKDEVPEKLLPHVEPAEDQDATG